MTIVKFGLVGLLNTAVGFAIILAALSAGLNDYAANALGYGLGLIISYSLNRYWTFSVHSSRSLSELMLFSGAFAVAYLANLLVLASFRAAGYIDQPLAHLSGLVVYSALFYLLSRYVVFGNGHGFALDPQSFFQRRRADLILLRSSTSVLVHRNLVFILAVIATFAILLLFTGKTIPVVIWDEGRIIVNAMEMRQTGLSLVTTYNFDPDLWNTKPPLLIWLMTGSMALFGPTEFALRLPSLISSLGTVLLVMLFLRRITRSVGIATFGGLALAISGGFFGEHGARTGDYDALLCFLTTGYLMLLFFALHRQPPPIRWILLAAVFGAAALMTKSVAGGAPAAGVFLYILITGRWRRPFTTPYYFVAGLLALAPLILFLALREYATPGYLGATIYNDVAGRFSEVLGNHSGPPWAYLQVTFVNGLFSLGTAVLLAPFALTIARGRTRFALIYALCIAFGLLVIVSISATKLQHYYLPAYPFLAIAAALAVHACLTHLKALTAAGALSSRRASIVRIAPVILLVIAMAQSVQMRLNLIDPRLDYPGARYGVLLDALAAERAPILLVDTGTGISIDPHYAPELRFHAMVARENGRSVTETSDISRLASVSSNTIVATCDPSLTPVLQAELPKLLLKVNGCVARRKVPRGKDKFS
ncbi:GtrA family protein [uncultured Parasphingorhabdus sp.]|mgnify:FL=1|uniref:GtrA family protein n=1 Tax=uncultured Parasphingorhabdus sp. TaxID=2709694 RepID=UPI0030DBC832|tara:strand:- start:39744 stop:41696 length:1953 start_codon:yes stop_codon:yes gene_type:complete